MALTPADETTKPSPGGAEIQGMLADDTAALTPAPIEELPFTEPTAGEVAPVPDTPPPSPGALLPEDGPEGPMVAAAGGSFFARGPKTPVVQQALKSMPAFAGRVLEETITVGKKTIKLDLSRLGADGRELDTLLNSVAAEYRSVLSEMKRGKITDTKLRALAAETGMTEEKVLQLVQGNPLNAEAMLAANQVLAAVGRRVLATRDEIKMAGALQDPAARQFMAGQLANLLEVEARTRGASSELGRALRALQVPVEGLGEAKNIATAMRQVADPTGKGFDRLMRLTDHIKTPEQAGRFARLWNAAPNALMEVWINSLLSGPATHVANLAGNTAAAANGVLERMIAGGVGALRRGNDRVYIGEAPQMVMAAMGGFSDAWRAAWHTFKTGEQRFMGSKFDLVHDAVSAEAFELSGVMGRAVNGLGTAVNLPKHGLMAQDEFFKIINFQMDLRARAFRMAKAQGLSGKRLREEMSRIMMDPATFREAHDASEGYARYATFARELGPMGAAMRDWSNAHPLSKMVAPFVTAPVNIAHYSFERYPGINLLMGSVRNDILGRNGGVARDLALAKLSVGTGAAALTAHYVFSGMITGRGPLNPQVRASLEAAGWQPYSIWNPVTKKYTSYERTDPLGLFLASVADTAQIVGQLPQHEAQNVAAGIAVALSGVMLNKTYVKGFAGLVEALEAGRTGNVEGGGVQHWADGYAASLVPAAVAQFTRTIDPQVKDVRNMLDAIYARVPGWSKDVPPKRDIYGRVQVREGGWGPDIASPFYQKTPKDEPGLVAIVENQIDIMPLSRTVIGPKENEIEIDPARAAKQQGVTLSPKEYDRWGELVGQVRLGGKTLKEALDAMAGDPNFIRQSRDMKATMVKGRVLVYRTIAKNRLFQENDNAIMKRVQQYYKEKGERMRPSRSPEVEEGSSVDSGISPGVGRLTQ